MKLIRSIAVLVAASAAGLAVAGPTCTTADKATWMPEAAFKAKMEQDGFKIKKFKVTTGSCYEIYGKNKEGKNVEIYFDPTNAAVVKAK